MTVPRSGAGEQGANRLNGLTVPPDNPADIGLAELQPKYRRSSCGDLGQHHFVRKFHQLPDYEFEKLFHYSYL